MKKYIQREPIDIGYGLRSQHYSHILSHKPKVSWFEAISENYLSFESDLGGRPLKVLEAIRQDYPVVLHGVSLSIGTVDEINYDYLKNLNKLIDRIQPNWVSDHLCWTGVNGENLHDLLPMPYTFEALEHLRNRIQIVQDFLKRPLVLENVSAYISFEHSQMTEWEFLSQLVARTGCQLLVDVNNIYVSSKNQNFNPMEFIRGLPKGSVRQMHLAGHSVSNGDLIDTHDAPVADEVWSLYRQALKQFGPVPTLIEWDAQIPEFQVLESEGQKALAIWGELHDIASIQSYA